MHLSGIAKDAATNFEVYLERTADEILAFHGKRFPDRKRSAPWDRLVDFYRLIDVEVATPAISEVRELRHILTHRRGELRTETQRQRFAGSQDIFMQSVAHLDAPTVESRMNTLADTARSVDPIAYGYTWGRERSEAIVAFERDPLIHPPRVACATSPEPAPADE